ncbi:MAG TPA: hypothetical protein DEF51_11050 [Myxococcales bacterium]|nr:hypothetical protein [Myxococcales bacterium]
MAPSIHVTAEAMPRAAEPLKLSPQSAFGAATGTPPRTSLRPDSSAPSNGRSPAAAEQTTSTSFASSFASLSAPRTARVTALLDAWSRRAWRLGGSNAVP